MIKYKNLTFLGTSHIAIESIKEVGSFIKEKKPDIIALELDRERFLALSQNLERKLSVFDIKDIGFKGFLFSLLASWIEKKLGKLVGVSPGAEMRQAIKLAKKGKIKVALIDQNIRLTLKKLSKAITNKEKFRFIFSLIKGLILRKPEIKIDLTKVPEKDLISLVLKKVKKDYPSFYVVLIKERNVVMAKNLYNLMQNHKDKKIFVITGAGHLPGLVNEIKRCG